jgi:FlaG/FlaF family flagellin (archaellin)
MLTRHSSIIATILLAAVVMVSAATGMVNGSVTRLGSAVAEAKVVIASDSDASYEAIAYSDSEGNFSFSGAPAGEIHVNVYDDQGLFLVSGTAALLDGEAVTIALDIP